MSCFVLLSRVAICLTILAGLMLVSVPVAAQAPDTAWSHFYGCDVDDEARTLYQMPDGGFVFGGYTRAEGSSSRDRWLVRTDSEGDTIWTRASGAADVSESPVYMHPAPDGGWVMIHSVGQPAPYIYNSK